MYNKSSSLSYCWTSPWTLRDTFTIRSLNTTKGTRNDIFLVGHFVSLDVKRGTQRCTSVLYVSSGAGIIIENIWQGILRLFPRIEPFVFLGYLNQLEKYVSVYLIAFQGFWKQKLFMYPPPLRNFLGVGGSKRDKFPKGRGVRKEIFFPEGLKCDQINTYVFFQLRESWKDWPLLRRLPTDPHSTDYPMDYSMDYPTDYPYGLPLIISQIPFTG